MIILNNGFFGELTKIVFLKGTPLESFAWPKKGMGTAFPHPKKDWDDIPIVRTPDLAMI